jgi:prepilin-type processing-associated H-X9-DG protein
MSNAETPNKAFFLSADYLRNFSGSENWYRHGLNRNVLFTDGAKHVADTGGAYWLLDIIALAQRHENSVAAEEFQVWKLKVNSGSTAALVCEDGNGTAVFTKAIEFTDFPADGVTLWFANNTIYLPSEH